MKKIRNLLNMRIYMKNYVLNELINLLNDVVFDNARNNS